MFTFLIIKDNIYFNIVMNEMIEVFKRSMK